MHDIPSRRILPIFSDPAKTAMALLMIERLTPQSLTFSARVATLATVFFFACAAAGNTAFAARSAWVETVGGGIRLVTGAPQADGSLPAMLEIRLEPGWRTYWTDPGSSGIPPEVTVTAKGPGAGNLVYSGLRLPVPKRFAEGDLDYTGYDRPVSFPLLLRSDASKDLTLEASVFLGICKSICIPVQAELDLELPVGAPDNALDTARVRAAFAALPVAPTADFNVTKATFDAETHEITLALKLPADATLSDIFLAAPTGYVFHPAGSRHPAGSPIAADGLTHVRIVAKLPPKAVGVPADGAIRATIGVRIGTEARAIETPLVFKP
ncbi:protein-disulfide reductase DsbD domain-containing protein [Rhizobium sp. 9140]|uniref:protein-disulfide reductase DsbD domain-containing protein n=1 Tax=Rhizobium sp. 9140 TaxID=1761900 RepID=UPI000799EBA1|nr:protein-disulfide reductase DsbD domain-containing protein [Rhizobium sp. 9140]CZT34445.1 Thiol-disulfide interchange protein, contains DsbC and DsbD domains [Rhizobium sp. 9140]